MNKQRIVAILLAFLFGVYGLHWFYLNDNQKGIKYLVCTIIGAMTSVILIGLIPLLVITIIALVDAIKFCLMTDEEFDIVYNRKQIVD